MSSEHQSREGDTLGDRVLALRVALGMTQEQFGRALGVKRLKVLAIEKGRHKFQDHRQRMALACASGLTIHVLDDYLDGTLPLEKALKTRAITSQAA